MAKLNAQSAAPEAPGRTGQNSNIITNWPNKENALLVKLIIDPTYDNGRKTYRPAVYFTHCTGTKESDKARHICQTFFGAKSSPENDAFWDAVKALSALKKAGQKESVDGKKAQTLVKAFKPSKRGYLMVVSPDSKEVKAVRIPESVIDILMGKKADNYNKEEIVSLLESMKAKGNSPFDLEIQTGWLRLYKTGEKLNTKYHVEVALVEKEDETKDGRKIKYMDDLRASVHPHLLSDNFELSEIPNVIEFEKRWAFTIEESQAFVAAKGTIEGTPERFLRKTDGPGTQAAQESDESGEPTVASEAQYQQVSEADIPY